MYVEIISNIIFFFSRTIKMKNKKKPLFFFLYLKDHSAEQWKIINEKEFII